MGYAILIRQMFAKKNNYKKLFSYLKKLLHSKSLKCLFNWEPCKFLVEKLNIYKILFRSLWKSALSIFVAANGYWMFFILLQYLLSLYFSNFKCFATLKHSRTNAPRVWWSFSLEDCGQARLWPCAVVCFRGVLVGRALCASLPDFYGSVVHLVLHEARAWLVGNESHTIW